MPLNQNDVERLAFDRENPSKVPAPSVDDYENTMAELPTAVTPKELLVVLHTKGRPALLAALKQGGVEKIGQRQRFANALSRELRIRPPVIATPPPAPTAPPPPPPPLAQAEIAAEIAALDVTDEPLAGNEMDRILRRFDAFHRLHSWKRLSEVDHVWATSDLHVEHSHNRAFLEALEPRPRDAIIVAGDVTHNFEALEWALTALVSKFRHVFFCCGNHELWSATGFTDSIEKMLALYVMATRIGAHVAPAFVGDAKSGNGIAIIGLQSWYHPRFLSPRNSGHGGSTSHGTQMTAMMDAAVVWPECLQSNDPGGMQKAKFFASLNRCLLSDVLPADELPAVLAASPEDSAPRPDPFLNSTRCNLAGWPLITYSHFLPRPELHRGYDMLQDMEGSFFLGDQLDALSAANAPESKESSKHSERPGHTHIFGHTHFSIDRSIAGIRYVQHPLGNPHERTNGWQIKTSASNPFARVWSRPHPSSSSQARPPNQNAIPGGECEVG